MKHLVKLHEFLKPTIYLASLMVGVLFSVYLLGKVFENLTRNLSGHIAITITTLVIIYWSCCFVVKIIKTFPKKKIVEKKERV